MDLTITEQQKILQGVARDFLLEKCPKQHVRQMEEDKKGYSRELWQEMADLGWMGLIFPTEYGGSGMTFFDLTLLLEEMGRVILPGPFMSTVVMGGLTILNKGSEKQKQEFLPKIADGKMILSLAFAEPDHEFNTQPVSTTATQNADFYHINGTKLFVPDARSADYLICSAKCKPMKKRSQLTSLFLVNTLEPGIDYIPIETFSGEKQYKVKFTNVKVPGSDILENDGDVLQQMQKVLQFAAIAKCAEMIGGAQKVMELSVNYAKDRVQFGRPIGSFQAIQHYCANMLIDVNASKAITYRAAWMLSERIACTREVSVAKAWVGQAYRRICVLAHQIHGAIGFTKDHDLQLFTRRAKVGELMFGDTDFHHEIVIGAINL